MAMASPSRKSQCWIPSGDGQGPRQGSQGGQGQLSVAGAGGFGPGARGSNASPACAIHWLPWFSATVQLLRPGSMTRVLRQEDVRELPALSCPSGTETWHAKKKNSPTSESWALGA